ncbi:lactate utilization protein C [Paenibacillus thermoaerophilus]|uniref:Lactate utilization protein C n=1 Tax=Paenibacillus thermoaerophilus TaxID=1215385 RepID=A0ABW2V9F9_9BACL|nr:LUD domain-containing protein [Paenibacillus thermoaerophilus]TMV17910.1 hypothetical protein FE781_05530 [Paenibacillus thermoaerophilus]
MSGPNHNAGTSGGGRPYGREAFLRNIANRLGRREPLTEAPKRDVRGVPEFYARREFDKSERIEGFVRNWSALTGKTLVTTSAKAREEIAAFLLEAIREHGIAGVTRWEHEELAALGLDEVLAAEGIPVVPWRELSEAEAEATGLLAGLPAAGGNWASRSPLLRAAERCRLGIVWPDAAIANTGTLVLQARGGRGRSVSLLPDVLFAIFRADQLVTRMGEAFERVRQGCESPADWPSSLNLVTGPSRSADIENDLTIGIHGPGKVYAAMIAD